MDTEKQRQLQADALYKLRESNFSAQIQDTATKQLPLTEADIAQLQHFCDSDSSKLKNTIYWANSVIFPAVTNRKTHRLTKKV